MKLAPRIVFWIQSLIVIGCFSVLSAAVKPGSYSAAKVTGTVTWTNPATQAVSPLTDGQVLPQGATITTGDNSTVILVFASGATATLSPNTSIEVSKFQQQAFTDEAFLDDSLEPAVSKTEMKLIQGEIIGQVRRLRTGSEFNINTPVGAAGVRGTTYSVSYNPNNGKFVIKTASGLVVYARSGENEVPVPAGQMFEGQTVQPMDPDELAEILQIAKDAVDAEKARRESSTAPGDPTRQNPINIDELSPGGM